MRISYSRCSGYSLVRLTPREKEIALLAADGMSSDEIALRLGISVHTINSHLRRTYAKLGITTRAQLGQKSVEIV